MPLQKLTNAELRVGDINAALEFHRDVLGLNEIDRSADRIFLGTGTDELVDLVLHEGGTGVAGFSIGADDRDDLSYFANRLTDAGIQTSRASDPVPGISERIGFALPSGINAYIAVTASETGYLHPARGNRKGASAIAPVDIDHITLRVADKVQETMDLLREILGFRSSDIVMKPDGKPAATWMHVGEYHHDVAMFGGNATDTLDHVAWQMEGIEHIKRALDILAGAGIKAEAGPGRHGVGGNIYAYFWAPGGNRYELSAEMPRAVNRRAPPKIWTDPAASFSSWGAHHPPSFANGS